MMVEQGISCLPVTNSDGMVEGILTWKDLIKLFLRQDLDS
jgi:CBS domain-containing protein